MNAIKFCLSLLAFFLISSYSIAQESNWLDKIDQDVWLKVEAGETSDFLIVLYEQADLSKANSFKIKEERAQYVFSQLKNLADHTQKELCTFLDLEQATYQSFFIVNGIYSNVLAAVNKALGLDVLPENETELEVALSPNPFTDELKIELKNRKGKAHFEIFDSLGKRLGETDLPLDLYTVRILQLDYLSSGVYYYFVTIGDDRVGGKVVKHE